MKPASLLAMLLCGSIPLAAHAKTITVAADGSGDFKTVQEALVAAPDNPAETTLIHIKPGTYQGPFIVESAKTKILLQGENPATTILTWDRNVRDPIPDGSDKFNPGMQIKADDFEADNLTIQNTSGDHGQALALRVDSDRNIFRNCRLLGWQDTLMVNNGRDYFQDCTIAGRVDFIYGSATALFDHCEIHSKNGGHVTAASTPEDHPFGFVFLDCVLTGDDTPWNPATTNPASTEPAHRPGKLADLGRPWRPYAAVAYIRCWMGDHIRPEGWNNWSRASNEKTARYAEYHSTGPGANPAARFAWTQQLTREDAAQYTIENVLKGNDNWNPAE